MGADKMINPVNDDLATFLNDLTAVQGADVVIVAAPAPQAQESALQLAGIGGRINFFGGLPKDRQTINFDSNIVHYKELIVTATTACSTADCLKATEIVNSGRVNLSDLISARFPLKRANEAFAMAEDKKALKVVLEP